MSRQTPLFGHPVFRFIVDHNPFFMLSAVCMLVACRLLLAAIAPDPGQGHVWKILMLVGTLNVYEFLLIGLAVFLVSRPACYRDVKILLILEALFLVDVTFLNSELYSAAWSVGLVVNSCLLVLAAVKLWMVRKVARLDDGMTLGFVLLSVAVLLAVPGVLAYWEKARDGSVTATTLYGFWWLAGALPAIGAMLLPKRREVIDGPWDVAVRRSFVALPGVSLVAHLCGASWVYDSGFYAANAAPVLLGLALAAPRWLNRYEAHAARVALPVAAVLLSMAPRPLGMDGAWMTEATFTPLRLAVLATILVYLWHAWEFRKPWVAAAVGLAGTIFALYHVPTKTWQEMARIITLVGDWCLSLLPRTVVHWGIVTLVTAFGLLGIGLIVSLRRRTPIVAPIVPDESTS